MSEKINILDVKIDAVNLDLACQKIFEWIKTRQKAYVCVAPVSTIVECQNDPDYKEIVNQADMVTPDGMPVVWLGKLRGNKIIERTYGPDLMVRICQEGLKYNCRHFFYGSTDDVLSQLSNKLKERFPGILIAGQFAPAFKNVLFEDESILETINLRNPDVLWVALGSPKQDFWMGRHRDQLNVPVMVGVGAAFDFLSGKKKQAPRWMRKVGLEWFFRLCSEPRRLWTRYLIGNSKFIYLLVKHFFRKILIGTL